MYEACGPPKVACCSSQATLVTKSVACEMMNLTWIYQGIIIIHMDFEFDPEKSEISRRKHGIDFSQGQRLWNDVDLVEIPARTQDEPRFLVIGMVDGKHWSVVITYREDHIRIISVRRSRDIEVKLYEGE